MLPVKQTTRVCLETKEFVPNREKISRIHAGVCDPVPRSQPSRAAIPPQASFGQQTWVEAAGVIHSDTKRG